jgi:hypothetical protein
MGGFHLLGMRGSTVSLRPGNATGEKSLEWAPNPSQLIFLFTVPWQSPGGSPSGTLQLRGLFNWRDDKDSSTSYRTLHLPFQFLVNWSVQDGDWVGITAIFFIIVFACNGSFILFCFHPDWTSAQPIVGHLFVLLTEVNSDSVFREADTDFCFVLFFSLGWLFFWNVTRPRRS